MNLPGEDTMVAHGQEIPLFEMALAITLAQRDALLLAAAVESDEEAE